MPLPTSMNLKYQGVFRCSSGVVPHSGQVPSSVSSSGSTFRSHCSHQATVAHSPAPRPVTSGPAPCSPSPAPTPVGSLGPDPELDRRRPEVEALAQAPLHIPEVGRLEPAVGEEGEGGRVVGSLHAVLDLR